MGVHGRASFFRSRKRLRPPRSGFREKSGIPPSPAEVLRPGQGRSMPRPAAWRRCAVPPLLERLRFRSRGIPEPERAPLRGGRAFLRWPWALGLAPPCRGRVVFWRVELATPGPRRLGIPLRGAGSRARPSRQRAGVSPKGGACLPASGGSLSKGDAGETPPVADDGSSDPSTVPPRGWGWPS